ncbi:MAG: hypothetical protein A3E07_00950 [Candidatus Wildermuthbacteria bacterium RIFCSPHIGHO2_12_FULL_45_9]|uniref:Uncharacterized protein n=1 Tax=Candidatus Wildermuthbacteria bacterium RIFCSPHIGHO2_02_FULL_45_25 TaxID=1802450 RepID=A0A1G2R1G5_9BACT|nr:MAG: hypothetical protein A2748_03330 [Candidatus Wildermuthbacteria bacterium RIFCSPHIGHO2_01_FULL_45_20]OHA66623.1 MAG: hypothetical protein A3C04_00505 [Candidatus Wildermuthbacteria bacterium RIFCSPHIGHO2_02_FULL_45_25]OHA71509.1 MAG: hypothetical protein A3E07_00950 [Candidatus Wildermuthbacteria bacterium RIFCSPHIGHO2_12_FULL_45_9]
MNHFDALAEFEKEFKRLFKKYKTLDDDFEKFKKILIIAPTGVGKNFVIIYSSPPIKIVKARMACRALHGWSLRIIYAYFEQNQKIEFIEMYFKGEKENEDRERIKEYLKNQNLTHHPI